MNEGDKVQIRRNVGNLGLCWLEGIYIGQQEGKHLVRIIDGDFQEVVACDMDVLRSLKYCYYRNTQDRCDFEREGDLIEQMDDDAEPIDFAEFAENVDYAEIATQLGYGANLSLENDWHVNYSKSKYGGVPCYILGHSVSDFIFLRPEDQKMVLGALQGRNDQTAKEWKRRTQFGTSGIDPR